LAKAAFAGRKLAQQTLAQLDGLRTLALLAPLLASSACACKKRNE
jgi:hypothetical protein